MSPDKRAAITISTMLLGYVSVQSAILAIDESAIWLIVSAACVVQLWRIAGDKPEPTCCGGAFVPDLADGRLYCDRCHVLGARCTTLRYDEVERP